MIGTLAVLAGLLLPIQPAGGLAPAPVCGNPEVLDRVSQRLRLRDHYAVLDRERVSEEPTGAGDVVRCGICVQVFFYDTPRVGDVPLYRCEPHGYVVQSVRGGFILLSVD